LSSAQHGFVKSRSTCTNLFDAVNDWTLTVQNKIAVTIAYIDFCPAFDTVSHNKLLLRLYAYGIRGLVLEWIKQFFRDRTHQTKVVQVVQGSGIGPVLFLIYIDDLAKLLERNGFTVKLFADDVKVYLELIESTDAAKLQVALDLIASWASQWQLQISVSKCSVLTVGRIAHLTHHTVGPNGFSMPRCTQCRDLGVTITSDLSSSQH